MKMRKVAKKKGATAVVDPKKLLVLALPMISEREIPLVQGVRKAFQNHKNIELLIHSGGYESTLRKLAESGQLAGAIGEFISNRWLESLHCSGVQIIQLGPDVGINAPSIGPDMKGMGKEAARVFMESGVKSVAYLGASSPLGTIGLGEAFVKECKRQGFEVSLCNGCSSRLLKNFLQSLLQPSGILCLNDRLARMAILTALELGLRVPQDLSVIGVGNLRMESLQAGIEISSFELPLEKIGEEAGRLMVRMLEGKSRISRRSVAISALLHERESSMHAASGVKRAMAYLRSHPDSSINAGELAQIAGMSRRSFECAVKSAIGCSPGQVLIQKRHQRAEMLLQEYKLTIAEVGQACGYGEPAVFSAAFKRWTGQSPRAFRAARRSQNP
jgi:DNA-binding LacI/PurR family transcriptional regulator